MIGLQNGNDPKVENLENYKMLISAITERAVEDYKAYNYEKGEALKGRMLTDDEFEKLMGKERRYLSAVRFFKSPQYALYADVLKLSISGPELMAELDRQKMTKRRKVKKAV